MERFSSSYVYKQSNFVLLGCEEFKGAPNDWTPIACVIENLLQRGTPTHPSKRLVTLLGNPTRIATHRPVRKLITHEHIWTHTIKGSPDGRYNPAAEFFTQLLPSALPPDKKYIVNYILPEALISDIVPECSSRFIEQCVDFYCPRANLVIEIDGSQHDRGPQSFLDRERDLYLKTNGIDSIRIKTDELSAERAAHLLCKRFEEDEESEEDRDESTSFAFEIALRTQIALVTLMKRGALSPSASSWNLDFTCDRPDIDADALITAAVEDIFDLLENICILLDKPFVRPKLSLSNELPDIRLDISATKAWSELESAPATVYARNDYYETEDYFSVSQADPITYNTTDLARRSEVDRALDFFLNYLFGYDTFRPGQAGIIRKALARSATLGILPTGSGKSLCYQMACLLQPCVNFVVCPIISLIQDQELNSHEFGIDRVGRIDSQMERSEKNVVLDAFGNGKHFFVWISPERFQTTDFRQRLSEISAHKHFAYAVIDEVHCLSEWGHDFRVSYLKLYGTIKKFCPEAKIIALTATASRNVLEDLLCELEITKANVQTSTSLDRPELKYHIVRTGEQDREEKLDSILDSINRHFQQTEKVKSIFEQRGKDSICGIIFSNIRNSPYKASSSCEGTLVHLKERGIQADSYHGGRKDERSRIQEEFLDNQFTVICATKAFGMGVNKKNIRYTIHNGLPWSIEAFYQEAGRAGRDSVNNDSECYILFSDDNDVNDVRRLFEESTSVEEIIDLHPNLSGDLDTLFFLWSGNHEDWQIERYAIIETFKWLFRNRNASGHAFPKFDLVHELTWEKAVERMKNGKTNKAEVRIETQDALYKLAILGIITDWTIDYAKRVYDVELREIDGESEPLVKEHLETYIRRHNPTFSFNNPSPAHRKYVNAYNEAPAGKKLIGLIDALLLWTNDNIAFSRRRAIGNMLELCESKRSEQDIRNYINSYFRLDTESNDQLDIIVRDSTHIETWLKLFMTYELTDDPTIQVDKLKDEGELASIAALCDRYRESFHANIGLEWSTMMARLLSNGFSDEDIESQFAFIASEMPEYDELDPDKLFGQTLRLLERASDDAKDAFGYAVIKHAPKRIRQTYDQLNDAATLTHLITMADAKLRSVWNRGR